MKKRKIIFLALFLLSFWAVVTVLITCPNLFREEDINTQYIDQVNILENKIESLMRSNNVLYHDIKSHLTQVRSNQVVDKIRLTNSANQNVPQIKLTDKNGAKIAHVSPSLPSDFVSPARAPVINYTGWDTEQRLSVIPKTVLEDGRPVIAVLVFSCDRVTVKRSLERLIKFRPSNQQFPIIVSQDCGHKPTMEAILSFGEDIFLIQQPDKSDIVVPPKEKKFKGYFKIARHYGWALNYTFNTQGFKTVIIVEDDLDVSEDFYEYFVGTYWLLRADSSLWCVSAWNDNGNSGLIDETQPQLLYRTDFFPGLGWMLTDSLWSELSVKWPRSYWDDWIRKPEQRKERACIRPEVSRTKTFGKVGVSNGLFYEKHLKYIKLNEQFVSFSQMNLSYLLKENYDKMFRKEVYGSELVTFSQLKSSGLEANPVRLTYHTKEEYKKFTKQLGLMDDFRSGVARTAYLGVVPFSKDGRRIYLAPQLPWLGYNVTWS